VSGDLKVKVKDIINEGPGFFSSYATELLPQGLKDALGTPMRGSLDGRMSDKEAQEKADQMFAPGGEKDWGTDTSNKKNKKSNIIVPSDSKPSDTNQSMGSDEPDTPYNLADENLAPSERIKVETPAGTMYKYPDGRWYQIPSTGIPTPANPAQYSVLDDYANRDGTIEKIPSMPKSKRRR